MDILLDVAANASLEAVERAYILKVLKDHDGNRTKTAKALRVSPRMLTSRIATYKSQGFNVPDSSYEPYFLTRSRTVYRVTGDFLPPDDAPII